MTSARPHFSQGSRREKCGLAHGVSRGNEHHVFFQSTAPPEGRQNGLPHDSLSPLRDCCCNSWIAVPTAHAVGYDLTPLRG